MKLRSFEMPCILAYYNCQIGSVQLSAATMPTNKGPLGILPGMTFDPVRNRYFPTRDDEVPARPSPSSNSLRAGFKERLKRGRGGGGVGGTGRTVSDEGSSKVKSYKQERSATKGKKSATKAAPGQKDMTDSSSCLDRKTRRIDRTLLRATGLELGRYDPFPSPTHAETQRRRQ
jgi:hypothetical protein